MSAKIVCVILMASVMVTSGCATVTRGQSDNVDFTSVPSGVTVSTSLGNNCVTPCQMNIKRKLSFRATFQKGQEKREVFVKPQASSEGVVAGAGNIIAGGVIGIAVDAGTGANLDHFPSPVHADFNQPANQSQAVAVAHAQKIKEAEAAVRAEEKKDAESAEGPRT